MSFRAQITTTITPPFLTFNTSQSQNRPESFLPARFFVAGFPHFPRDQCEKPVAFPLENLRPLEIHAGSRPFLFPLYKRVGRFSLTPVFLEIRP